MKKILVAIDSSEFSKIALDKAKAIAKKFESKLVILHVIDTFSMQSVIGGGAGLNVTTTGMPAVAPAAFFPIDDYKATLEEAAKKVLDSAKESCKILGNNVSAVKLEGNPADMIIEYVEANKDIDLVVMGSHGLSGIKRFFVGSVTNKVNLSIDRSILIAR